MHYYSTDYQGHISSPSPKNITVAQRAETYTYSLGAVATSLLDVIGLRALNLLDSENNAALLRARRGIAKACLDEKDVILASARATANTKIFYDLNYFSKSESVIPTCFTNAKVGNEQQRARWRHLTKHRTIASIARFHANGFGEIFSSGGMAIGVVTHCAPNLSGTSPADERVFLNEGALRDPVSYYQIMKLAYLRMMFAAIHLRGTVVITPLFGGGLYVAKLKKAEDKARAWNKSHLALVDAYTEMEAICRELRIPFTLQELVYCIPDKYEIGRITTATVQRDATFISAQFYCQNYQGTGKLTLMNADCLAVAANAASKGKKPILFNPGSDCIVGGGYAEFVQEFLSKGTPPTPTLEEIYATVSDFVFRQAADYAPNYEMQAYPSQLEGGPTKNIFAKAADHDDNSSTSTLSSSSATSSPVRNGTVLGFLQKGVAQQPLLNNQDHDRQQIVDLMQYYFVQYQKLQPFMKQVTAESSASAPAEFTVPAASVLHIQEVQTAADATTVAQQLDIVIGIQAAHQHTPFYIQYSKEGMALTTIGFSVITEAILYLNNMNENDPAQPEDKYSRALTALNEVTNQPLFRQHFADALERYSASPRAN